MNSFVQLQSLLQKKNDPDRKMLPFGLTYTQRSPCMKSKFSDKESDNQMATDQLPESLLQPLQ